MQFNEKLKKLRADKGLSQEELAKKIFVSRSAVAKWENGLGLPGEASLNALAEFFSVSKDELLYDKETETLIVEKNITISKSKKSLIVVSLVSFIVILSFILSLFPEIKRCKRIHNTANELSKHQAVKYFLSKYRTNNSYGQRHYLYEKRRHNQNR